MAPGPQTTRLTIATRAIAVWLVLIVAEILHGITRGIFLVPHVGEFRSNQIGVFTGSVIILVIALIFVRWIGASRTSDLLAVGGLWLGPDAGIRNTCLAASSWGLRGSGWPPTTTCWKAGCCRSEC